MRTNNFFSIAALVICGLVCFSSVKAEGTPIKSDQVTVNIKFKPIQSIVVNPNSAKEVNFIYKTPDHYTNGVAAQTFDNHLIVNSTGAFVVNVKAGGDFTGGLSGEDIDASDVTVEASKGTNNKLDNPSYPTVELGTGDQPLITSTNGGGMGIDFDVTYSNPGGKGPNYINKAK